MKSKITMNRKKSDIAIIVVTYNPDISVLSNVLTELDAYNDIYISDNGSNNFEDIYKVSLQYRNVFLINNRENVGIGVAQNVALDQILKQEKYRFTFYLDQDSFVRENVLQKLKKEYLKLLEKNIKVGSISVVEHSIDNKPCHFEFVNQTISSGMLIPVQVLKQVGNMYGELFIDWIDYEWCWRAKKNGFKIVRDNECFFQHEIGTDERVLGKIPPAPFRLYYVYRNIIILMADHKTLDHSNMKWGLFKQFIFNTVFCPNRLQRVKYIIWGIKDGKKRVLGKNTRISG